MEILRAVILFLVFLVPSLSQADTIPATKETAAKTNQWYHSGQSAPPYYQTALAACQGLVSKSGGAYAEPVTVGGDGSCVAFRPSVGYTGIAGYAYQTNACPSGYVEVSGVCERWTCPQGYTGPVISGNQQVCTAVNPCAAKAGQESFGWTQYDTKGPSPWGPRCKDGCEVYQTGPVTHPTMNPDGDRYAGPGYYVDLMKTQFTGGSCSTSDEASPTAPPDKAPPAPRKDAPCAPGEGVMTSSSGKVSCVPPGTPGSNPPIVKKEKDVQQFPDGSTKTTETTTTRDPATGAETKSQHVTVTVASTGLPGSAGTPGTTVSGSTSQTTVGGNGTDPEADDFCTKNPGLDICSDKLAKEETAKAIKGELEKLNAGGDDDFSALTNAKATDAANDQLTTENQNLTEAATGVTDVTQSQRSSWQQAMEDGWFSPVSVTGCTPFVLSFAGRSVTIDHCEKAALIASILEYALWFSVAVGTFVMFTGGSVRSN